MDFADGSRWERETFQDLRGGEESAAQRHHFFAERAALKLPGVGKDVQPRPVKKIAVIGAGTMGGGITMSMATGGYDVVMIDKSREALDRGWREAQGLKKVTTKARDLFRNPMLSDEFRKFDAVVIDPPRAGAEAQIGELAAARVPVIAHVSCNPVTFARDAAWLIAAGYRMGPVRVVDQFRWSAHVELVAGFRLTSS